MNVALRKLAIEHIQTNYPLYKHRYENAVLTALERYVLGGIEDL